MKKMLVLSPYFPWPLDEGGHIRTFNIIKALSKKFEIYLFSFLVEQRSVETSELMNYCKDCITINVPNHRKDIVSKLLRNGRRVLLLKNPSVDTFLYTAARNILADYIQAVRPDFAIIEHSWLAPYAPMLKASGIKTVLDAHNIEADLWKQFYNDSNLLKRAPYYVFWKSMVINEKKFMPYFDLIISTSESEDTKIKEIAPHVQRAVIPNGVDLDRCVSHEPEEENSVFFIGLMRYPPNMQAVSYFLEKIFPSVKQVVPDVKFYIAGKDPAGNLRRLADGKNIVVTGYVPDALRFMAGHAVMVAPFLQGSGTRTKILEAMALKKPVVATSRGAEGLAVQSGRDIFIADDPESFAGAIIRLLRDRELRTSVGEAAYKTVAEHYSWASIGSALIALMKEVA